MVRKAVHLLHVAWAVLCIGLSVALALMGGGHPPPVVLVPFVLVAWVIGHGTLWLIIVLVRRGRRGLPPYTAWPPGVTLALVGLAAFTALTLFQVAVSVLLGKFYPYRGLLWFLMTGIGALHGAGLIGMLLRRNWGRVMALLVCFGWSALIVAQTIEHLSHGRSTSAGESALALVLFAVPAGLGLHLLLSRRVRAFFALN